MKRVGILSFFFIISIVSINGQDWEELDSLGHHYSDEEDYLQANQYAQLALDAFISQMDQVDTIHCHLLYNLAYTQYKLQQYERALIPFEKARVLSISDSSISKQLVINIHNYIGSIYKILHRPKEGIPYYQTALLLTKTLYGSEHPKYGNALNNLGTCYEDAGEYNEALRLNSQAIKIFEQHRITFFKDYLRVKNNRTSIYYRRLEYHKVLSILEEVVQITKDSFGITSDAYMTYQGNLGMTFLMLGAHDKAKDILLDNAELIKEVYGEQHIEYLGCLQRLGGLYKEMKHYQESSKYFEQLRIKSDSIFGKTHYYYLSSLENLGTNYEQLELYNQAYRYLLELKSIVGESKAMNRNAFRGLVRLMGHFGQFEEAITLQQKVIEDFKNYYGENHLQYWLRKNDQATLYHQLKQYQKAKFVYLEIINWIKKNKRTDVKWYPTILSNLGSLYDTQGKLKKALRYLKKAQKAADQIQGEKHSGYSTILGNQASIYNGRNKPNRAIALYNRAIALEKRTGQSVNLPIVLDNLAGIHLGLGEYDKAYRLYLEIRRILLDQMDKTFLVLDENEREKFFSNIIDRHFSSFRTFVHQSHQSFPEALAFMYDNTLIQKGLLLKTNKGILEVLQQEDDSSKVQQFQDLRNIKQVLAKQYSTVNKSVGLNLDSLANLAKDIERDLLLNSLAFRQFENRYTWKDVRDALKEGEAAIEFVRFQGKIDKENGNRTPIYAGLVVRPGYETPQMVYLVQEKELETLLDSKDKALRLHLKELYQRETLFEKLWKPLDSLLRNVDKVYYAPTGLLHRVAIPALVVGTNSTLSDKYNLVYVSSTLKKIRRSEWGEEKKVNYGILYGAIKYDTDSLSLARVHPQYNASRTLGIRGIDLLPSDQTGDKDWGFLPYSLEELQRLERLFKRNKIFTMTRQGFEATEESFKAIGETFSSPSILHLATHGFFFSRPNKLVEGESASKKNLAFTLEGTKNPLLRSGLILSGANRAWIEGKPLSGYEDGIVTASEISHLNLNNTELVVLSACNTALGEIRGDEGVYGLQRAFKMAGAEYLLLTLWSIPDSHHTVEFMDSFYSHWLREGISIRDAFRKTQSNMREKYKDPYYWAPFVLIE